MHPLSIHPPFRIAHLAFWYFVLEFEHLHGVDHALHRHEDVLVDELGETAPVLIRVADAVDDSHLLDEGGLPRLPRSCRNINEWLARGLAVSCALTSYKDLLRSSLIVLRSCTV